MSQPRLLRPLRSRDVVVVVGKRGKGKSTFVKRSLAKWPRRTRVLVWDPHDEYSVCGQRRDDVELGPVRAHIRALDLLAHPELLDDPELSLCVIPTNVDDEALTAAEFRGVYRLVKLTGDLTFIVSEAFIVCETCRFEMGMLGTQSRHWGVALVVDAQRAVHVHPNCRSQADKIIAFRQDHPADIDALREAFGVSHGRELAEQVANLPPYDAVEWTDDEGPTAAPA